jgi:ankyrin repeat protein
MQTLLGNKRARQEINSVHGTDTALTIAHNRGCNSIVQLLIENGASTGVFPQKSNNGGEYRTLINQYSFYKPVSPQENPDPHMDYHYLFSPLLDFLKLPEATLQPAHVHGM